MRSRGRIPDVSDSDDDEWMTVFRALPDTDVDALLAGRAAPSVAGGLSDVVRVLQLDAARHGAPPMSDALRAQVTGAAPVRAATRRRRVLAGGLGGLLLGGAAMGVAGAQDVLPAPIQDATASVADLLGVDLPRSAERDAPAGGGTSTDGAEPEADGGSSPSSEPTPGTTSDEKPETETPATAPGDEPNVPAGPPDSTAGGATPADPGTPGDHEPATPATPATGNGNGNGNNASETGQVNGRGNNASETGQVNGTGNNASETGQVNGSGTTNP